MGTESGYKPGDWKAQCFRCGFTRLASTMRKQWQGYWVCPEHWEPRQPQDFVRGVSESPAAPWVQPENWTYVGPVIPDPIVTEEDEAILTENSIDIITEF